MLKDERCKAYLINGAHSTEKQNVSAFQLHSLQNALDIWLESTFLVHLVLQIVGSCVRMDACAFTVSL